MRTGGGNVHVTGHFLLKFTTHSEFGGMTFLITLIDVFSSHALHIYNIVYRSACARAGAPPSRGARGSWPAAAAAAGSRARAGGRGVSRAGAVAAFIQYPY